MGKDTTAGPTRAIERHIPVFTAGGSRDAEIATPTRLFTFLLKRLKGQAQEREGHERERESGKVFFLVGSLDKKATWGGL